MTDTTRGAPRDAGQLLLLGAALVAGLLLAILDAQPTWDDTGITALSVAAAAGIVTFLGQRRPWLVALAVGAWIPLHALLVTHNLGSILALGVAAVGAALGSALRRAVSPTGAPT